MNHVEGKHPKNDCVSDTCVVAHTPFHSLQTNAFDQDLQGRHHGGFNVYQSMAGLVYTM